MAGLDTKGLINYGGKALGAVAMVQVANKMIPTIMANQFLSYAVYDITVGAVLAAGIGIWAVEQLILK